MLAEAVKLNGKVWAQDTQVVTGKNAISVDSTGKVTNTSKTEIQARLLLQMPILQPKV